MMMDEAMLLPAPRRRRARAQEGCAGCAAGGGRVEGEGDCGPVVLESDEASARQGAADSKRPREVEAWGAVPDRRALTLTLPMGDTAVGGEARRRLGRLGREVGTVPAEWTRRIAEEIALTRVIDGRLQLAFGRMGNDPNMTRAALPRPAL